MLNDKTKIVDGNIVFTGDYMEFYIPEYYFDRRMAEQMGEQMRVFGLFNLQLFDKNNKKIGKLETFNVPSTIIITSTEIEDRIMNLSVGEDDEEQKYTVVKFRQNDVIMRQGYPQDSSNVSLFLDMLTSGKIPRTIPYNKILSLWQENLRLNGVHLNVASNVLEAIIAEIYRDPKNPEKKFASIVSKSANPDQLSYRPASIREVCAYNSTFSALTFEDFDQMANASINIKRYNKEQSDSPLEKIIRM